MTDEKIKRINFLAKKSKAEGLSDEEKAEQQILRNEYREDFKKSMMGELKTLSIVEPDGTKHKVVEKE